MNVCDIAVYFHTAITVLILITKVPDIQQPKITVTKCKDDGSYEIKFEYKVCTMFGMCCGLKIGNNQTPL